MVSGLLVDVLFFLEGVVQEVPDRNERKDAEQDQHHVRDEPRFSSMAGRRHQPYTSSRFPEQLQQNERGEHRDDPQDHRHRQPVVDAQLGEGVHVDAQCERLRKIAGTAFGEHERQVEQAQDADGGEGDADGDRLRQHRDGDEYELLEGAGAIDVGGFVQLTRDRIQARQVDEDEVAERGPDDGEAHCRQHGIALPEPVLRIPLQPEHDHRCIDQPAVVRVDHFPYESDHRQRQHLRQIHDRLVDVLEPDHVVDVHRNQHCQDVQDRHVEDYQVEGVEEYPLDRTLAEHDGEVLQSHEIRLRKQAVPVGKAVAQGQGDRVDEEYHRHGQRRNHEQQTDDEALLMILDLHRVSAG